MTTDKPFDVLDRPNIYLAHHLALTEETGHVEKTRVVFARKEPKQPGYKELEITLEGTTCEALIGILIDRVQFLNEQVPCAENRKVLQGLNMARDWLDRRLKDRINRGVEGTTSR